MKATDAESIRPDSSTEDAGGRRDLYRFLACAFLNEPSEEMVRVLSGAAFLDDLGSAFGEESIRHLREFSRVYRGDLEFLGRDFNALFKVPALRYVAPYESVFVDKREVDGVDKPGLLMGPAFRRLKAFFASAGYHLTGESNEVADHVGHELDFMSRLCEEEAGAASRAAAGEVDEGRALQLRFLEQHLGAWLPELARKIQANAASPFYSGIAALADCFVRADCRALRESLAGAAGP